MDKIKFKVNGKNCSVGGEVCSKLTLVDYLRNVLELRGTKYMCREAGCGACIVTAVKSPGVQPVAVNSCLVSVTSCEGWEITTIEKVGNKLDGYHKLQTTLADHHGTQCGHCTPGWIMAMYSLLQQKKDFTKLDIEKSFASNICRCTGYRPILDAFKTFAKDASDNLLDIEDLNICNNTGKNCKPENCNDEDWCHLSKEDVHEPTTISFELKDGKEWYTVFTIKDIFEVFSKVGDNSYMLASGNTAKGVFPIDEYPRYLIDISKVSELKGSYIDQNLAIGAGNTLTEIHDIFQSKAKEEEFTYLSKFCDHLDLVATIPVKNLGSLAGNLMIKHNHNEFPSDLFLLLETVGAKLSILTGNEDAQTVSLQQFLKLDMKFKIISKVLLPPLNSECHIVTFKVMPRSQNAFAIVNAGFFYKYKSDHKILQSRLVFGGLSPTFVRANKTEKYLIGKHLFKNETLQEALKILGDEFVIIHKPPALSVEYRKKLALGLFYKGLLILYPEKLLTARYDSGTIKLNETRPVSKAKQNYDTNPALWPLNKPMNKVEALFQCSGEAEYVEDLPSFPREVFAAFVLATVANGKIKNIDSSKALAKPGVIAFYTAKDIPGVNSFTPSGITLLRADEELFCEEKVKYYNQPVGVIVAESRSLAEDVAKLVEVTYSDTKNSIIIDLEEAVKDENRKQPYSAIIATNRGFDIEKVVSGKNQIREQYHMCMETLVSVTRPTSQGIEVHTSTQWPDGVQVMISRALKMDSNRIDVYVPRIGGAFGVKVTRTTLSAVACSLVTFKLNRPCRLIQPLTTNMRVIGKRCPCLTEYEVGVDLQGVIQYVNCDMNEGHGYMYNETLSEESMEVFNNCYCRERWNFNGYEVLTDTPKNTWCRAPATLEAIGMAEHIMEHISYELSLDPVKVRLANLDTIHRSAIEDMFETLKSNSDYDERRAKVEKFNKENRWKKKGLRTSFMKWTAVGGPFVGVNIAIYHDDGTVVITHGGVEMGQGINTLAIQTCAYILKIDQNKIQVKGNNTINVVNCDPSEINATTSNVCIGVQKCCAILMERLLPIMAIMPNLTWEKVIKKAYELEIDLQAHSCTKRFEDPLYFIYGVAFAEVIVDILTGESEILRVDLHQDAGRSINPQVDIGQAEGAFIMGQGFWTCEDLIYNKETGQILTDRSLNYHVPMARDIPQDFRVYLKKKSMGNEVILGSKSISEPPICLSVVVALAIREAIVSARLDSGIPTTEWFPTDGPMTTEKICLLSETKTSDFKFY